ncbi:hypothetical protein P9112_001003 [Eukaryota sp. TZLM1-RC]
MENIDFSSIIRSESLHNMSRTNLSEDFKIFKQSIQRKSASILGKTWNYYQAGPREESPLILLHSATGTAECFYRQISSLSPRGFNIVSVTIPDIHSIEDFLKAFEIFVTQTLKFRKYHLLGVGLGGLLAQAVAANRPACVLSLILSNTFCDTQTYCNNKSTMIKFLPEFAIRRTFLANFPHGEVRSEIADAADFIVYHMDSLTRHDLLARYNLHCTPYIVPKLQIPDHKITIIDACDVKSLPGNMRNEVYKRYPDAKRATLKFGGEFVMLASADEMSLFIQVHLRNVNAEEN